MTLRVLIVIPTYNNPQTIDAVVCSTLQTTSLSILIVDDGSDQPVLQALKSPESAQALASGRLHILRKEKNGGKGRALQESFRWALDRGFTHILSLDGDGQHLPCEIPTLLQKILENPWDLIIGQRKMEQATVPGLSHFGRKFSNFWVGYQTGQQILDSQSGFRVYPLFHVQNLTFWTSRFDFEIEVLIRLLWRGVRVTEVNVDVHYPPPEERVSHFHKFFDNARISFLNTLLVIVCLLRFQLKPRDFGWAVGWGVFIGCTPFFGFHTLLLGAVAFLARLNFPVMFLASHVSFPPFALGLIPLEIATGRAILKPWGYGVSPWFPNHFNFHELLHTAMSHFPEWFVGSLVIGVSLALFLGGGATLMAHTYSKLKKPQAAWSGRTRGGRFGNGFLKWVLRTLGLRTGYFCLLFVVPYFYIFAPRARRAAHEYWGHVYPRDGFFRRRWRVLCQMFRFGQVLMDRALQSLKEDNQFLTNPNGLENILTLLQTNQRVLLQTAHVGSWDLATRFLNTDGYDGQFHMVHYEFSGFTFEKAIGAGREINVQSVLANRQPILEVKQLLEAGQPVGLMGDRAGGTHFELVSFFGGLVPFDARPTRIAAACQCSIVNTFGFKQDTASYSLFAKPARKLTYSGNKPRYEEIYEWVQEFASEIETLLRHYPTQWFNFFPIFSSVPAAPPEMTNSTEQHSLIEPWQKLRLQKSELGPDPRPSAEIGFQS